jgi:hypothetical protein
VSLFKPSLKPLTSLIGLWQAGKAAEDVVTHEGGVELKAILARTALALRKAQVKMQDLLGLIHAEIRLQSGAVR